MEKHVAEGAGITAPEELLQERLEFGLSLGLQEPVSQDVFYAVLRDESYAHNLRVSSRTPAVLKMLLMNPPKPRQGVATFSTAELAGRAAKALARWAETGFSVVDQPTLERRRRACSSCPNLSAAPEQLAYKLTPGGGDVCALCGCKI